MSSIVVPRAVLAIESSCDETSLALLSMPSNVVQLADQEWLQQTQVLATVISSQIELHKQYGGVVPELGARRHANQIHFLWLELLDQLDPKQQASIVESIDKIMVTTSPGLVSALRVGQEFAKSVKFFIELQRLNRNRSNQSKNEVEVVEVNHLRGHVASCLYQV